MSPRADGLVLLGAHERLAVLERGRRLQRGDEARADDGALRAERQRDAATVDDAARGDDGDLHRVDHLGHERHRADLARVAAGLRALRGDDVGARLLGANRVLHLAGHDDDLHAVRLHVGDVLLRHREAGDEDLHLLLEEHGDVGHDHLRNRREQVTANGFFVSWRVSGSGAQVVGRAPRRP